MIKMGDNKKLIQEEINEELRRKIIVLQTSIITLETTLRQIGILDNLKSRGTVTLNPFAKEVIRNKSKSITRRELTRRISTTDVFIASTNAVTLDGKLVNIDSVGNRVAAMIFGPKNVIIVVGKNKIVKDVEEALYRIKNVIAPYHAKTKKIPTPCAITGKCINCSVVRRICNVITILEKKPRGNDTTVILVNEDLGLSWDESWDPKRINKIKSRYQQVTWETMPFKLHATEKDQEMT